MARYENLKFFDSQSNDLNMSYDSTSEKWTGTIYLPEVSTGLFETSTIYILEEVEAVCSKTIIISSGKVLLNKETKDILKNKKENLDSIFRKITK